LEKKEEDETEMQSRKFILEKEKNTSGRLQQKQTLLHHPKQPQEKI
jgi:hypothetical protein